MSKVFTGEVYMSGGKRFLDPEAEMDVIDRLSILERKIPAFLEKISTYDRVLDEFNVVKTSQEKLISNSKFVNEALDRLDQLIKKLSSDDSVNILHQGLDKQKNDLVHALQQHENVKNEMRSQLDTLRANIYSFQDKIDNQISLKADKAEEDKKLNYLRQSIDDISAAVKVGKIQCEQLSALLFDQKKETEFKFNSIDQQIQKRFLELGDKLFKLNSIVYLEMQSLRNQQENNGSLIDSKLDNFKSNLALEFSNQDWKNEILKKFDLISIDSSNASLRSQNSDQQIKLLEKKIENMSLILKKQELSVR